MNFYRVVFSNATVLIAATDSDMACINAAKDFKKDTGREPGDLLALGLINPNTGMLQELRADADKAEIQDKKVLEFIRKERLKALPKRRQKGMTLSYDNGDLFVTFFGYSASLSCAAYEGLLHPNDCTRSEYELSPAQQSVVDEWLDYENEYYEANGWRTWDEVNG